MQTREEIVLLLLSNAIRGTAYFLHRSDAVDAAFARADEIIARRKKEGGK